MAPGSYRERLRRKAIERSRKRRRAEDGKAAPATVTRPCERCGQPVQITAWSVAVVCAYCETGVPRPA